MSGNQKSTGVKWLIKEFPNKKWSKRGVEDFQKRLRTTRSIEQAPVSGRPRTTCTAENVDAVGDLVQSQENQPQTHRSTQQISRELRIPQTNNWRWLSVLFWCERKWTKNNSVFNWKVLLFKFTKYGAHTIKVM